LAHSQPLAVTTVQHFSKATENILLRETIISMLGANPATLCTPQNVVKKPPKLPVSPIRNNLIKIVRGSVPTF
jgi:hypothetical protein